MFPSYLFLLVFAPVACAGYWALPPGRARLLWLTAAGYTLYALIDWRFTPVLLAVTLANFAVGRQLVAGGRPRLWLFTGVVLGLLPLVVFKYAGPLAALLGPEGSTVAIAAQGLALPIGISFYSFQSLTYTLDLFHRRGRPAESLLHFAAFTSLFPSFVSGPISRWSTLSPDLLAPPQRIAGEQVVEGVVLVVLGLAQKTVVADTLERIVVAPLFAAGPNGFFLSWIAALAYGARLYFDFAGYSDMAIGLGRLLGLALPRNFAQPYQARHIAEFWQRWHISLSSWFRDYLFFPVSRGLLRLTQRRYPDAVRALSHVLTMALIGLWHGATAALLVWGLFHGALLVLHHQLRLAPTSVWSRLERPITYLAVTFGWVLFRSPDLASALSMWQAMLGLHGFEPGAEVMVRVGWPALVFVLAAVIWLQIGPDAWDLRVRRTRGVAIAMGVLAAVALGLLVVPQPFVYFRF